MTQRSKDQDQFDHKTRICFGEQWMPEAALQLVEISEQIEGRHIRKTISATVQPDILGAFRWDYTSEVKIFQNDELIFTCSCVRGQFLEDGSLRLDFEGPLRDLERRIVQNLVFFGMTGKEHMHFLPRLAGLKVGEIQGFVPNSDFRPFLFEVPIKGLKAEGLVKSLQINDLGVTSGEADTMFYPLIQELGLDDKEPLWKPEVPKAFGVVIATDLVEAEILAWKRAEFTAESINFSLKAGVSHLDNRLNRDSIEWNADIANSRVQLAPWILVREVNAIKGWVREVPWLEPATVLDLSDIHGRLEKFIDCLSKASMVGDTLDQSGKRDVSKRERRLIIGIQRALHWYAVASTEGHSIDRFLSLWIALEAILGSIAYPGVFAGKRAAIKRSITKQLRQIDYSTDCDSMFSLSSNLFENRVNRDEWPLPRRLEMFAQSLGIALDLADQNLVRELGRARGNTVHSGDVDFPVPEHQLRSLKYLVERLVIASGVCAYADLEDETITTLKFGTIPPEGGGAPIAVDGKEVSYVAHGFRDESGGLQLEYLIEGKVYREANIRIEPA